MKTIHSLILAIAATAAGIPALEAVPAFVPAAPYLQAAQAVLILVGAVLSTLDAPPSSRLARRS